MGARVTEVVVRHHPRRHGRSKYGIARTVRVIYDLFALRMLTRFAARPLHGFGLWSTFPFLLAALLVPLTFIDHTSGEWINFSTSVFPTILVLMVYLGFHFLVIGLLAELAVNVLRTRPHYVHRLFEGTGGPSTAGAAA
jgi:dolichol-phosphate mannosyltransferase